MLLDVSQPDTSQHNDIAGIALPTLRLLFVKVLSYLLLDMKLPHQQGAQGAEACASAVCPSEGSAARAVTATSSRPRAALLPTSARATPETQVIL